MLKVLLIFWLLVSMAYAGGLEEVYWVPIYPSYKVSQTQLPILMHTLEHLPDPAYITDRRLTREEVIFSNRNWDEARAGLQFWARRTIGDETLINTLGKLYTAANYGHKSATSDMLTLYETAIKFFTELEPKPQVVAHFKELNAGRKISAAERNWEVSKSLIPPRPAGQAPFLMIVPGGYVYPIPPIERYRAAVASFIAGMFRRSSISSDGSGGSSTTAEHDSGDEVPETDALLKKRL